MRKRTERISRREWYKDLTHEVLRGELRVDFDDDQWLGIIARDVERGLMAMSADSAYGNDGIVAIADKVGLTDEQYAKVLNIPIEVWLRGKKELLRRKLIVTREVDVGFHIFVVDWKRHQPDYTRTRKYRDRKEKEAKSRAALQDEVQSFKEGYKGGRQDAVLKTTVRGPHPSRAKFLEMVEDLRKQREES